MQTVSIILDENTYARLLKTAARNGVSVEECVAEAVSEYIENNEDCRRADLSTVNAAERAFFFGAGE